MKYVFFDIECACVFKSVAKICAFGYVLTDENFNVLVREDILIDPKGKFHLTDRKGREGLVLPYEYEDFKKYPPFPAAYKKIRSLLEDNDSIVLGHATLNDVNYLNLETRRYKLPSFRFRFHDTQFFYMNLTGEFNRQCGLGVIGEKLGVEFTPHRAVDDAYATMRVCEAICKREQKSVQELVEFYQIRAGRLEGGRIYPPDSEGRRAYLRERERVRQEQARLHDQFYRYVNKYMHRRKKDGPLDGKVFCFSKDVENDVERSVKLVGAIFNAGGRYTSHPKECDVFVGTDDTSACCKLALENGASFVRLENLEASWETVTV